jgi:mannose-6-phosphate isomerase
MEKLYPLIFNPILKELIWGGTDILPFKGLPSTDQTIGESWELSHVEGNYSVVANGALAGMNIDELIRYYGEELLGSQVVKRTGTTFPLLIKFIDARQNLSVQVHPNDEIARLRHNSFGKTEMWYVVKAADNACLFSGFARQTNPDEYVQLIENNTFMDVLQRFEVEAGDVFFLPAGRVHAIGAGCFIAEIQQTSNITYRIYDYDRRDANGNPRKLHTELAKDAIDYQLYPDVKTSYAKTNDVNLVSCNYFITNLLQIETSIERKLSSPQAFSIFICTRGDVLIEDGNGNAVTLQQGQTVLIPAIIEMLTITPIVASELLEVTCNASTHASC